MTWNVWWRFGADWQARQEGIRHTLERLRPDVVGLQESWAADGTTQAAELAGPGLYTAFAAPSLPPLPASPTPDQQGVELGVGLISRWPLADVRRVPLPATHRDQPVSLVATVAHPDHPFTVVVTCTEWEPAYADDHLAQTEALAALVGELDGPVLLLGDLNAPVDSRELAPLLAVCTDAWAAGGGAPGTVTLSSEHPEAPVEATKQIDRRIDHVLTSSGGTGRRWSVERAFVAGEPVDGSYPSDHFAVVADLRSAGPAERTPAGA